MLYTIHKIDQNGTLLKNLLNQPVTLLDCVQAAINKDCTIEHVENELYIVTKTGEPDIAIAHAP